MSEPIRVGDLVIIVGNCCADADYRGEIHTVTAIHEEGGRCRECGFRAPGSVAALPCPTNPSWGIPLSWLKRIPPLSELESTHNEEKAPA